jgi:hypothetical protein
LFADAAFAFSNLAALLHYAATFAVGFLLSLYLQSVRGLDVRAAGLVLLAQPVLMALLSPLAGRLSDRVEPRLVATAGMFLTCASLALFALLEPTTPIALVLGGLRAVLVAQQQRGDERGRPPRPRRRLGDARHDALPGPGREPGAGRPAARAVRRSRLDGGREHAAVARRDPGVFRGDGGAVRGGRAGVACTRAYPQGTTGSTGRELNPPGASLAVFRETGG